MNRTSYGCSRTFGDVSYTCAGFDSHEDALENVYRRAFEDGRWKPRELRTKWWQFWRPKKHNEIERKFVNRKG